MQKIPLLDLKKQYQSIKGEIDSAIKRVVDDQAFIMGKDIKELEKNIASFSGTKYAIGVSSGTDALLLALKAAGIGNGDEVITVPFTFIATAEAISQAGAKPVFCDVDPKTYIMNPSSIKEKITAKTKAIIPVHLYGQCADMDEILKIAEENKLKVIEDCAQAIGAKYKGNRAGSFGDAGCISFFPSKNLGCFGDGGMIVTNDAGIAEQAGLLRVHGSAKRYMHSIIGYNSRLDNLQAAILNVKLKYLDTWAAKRRENATFFNAAFEDLNVLIKPFVPKYNEHVYHQYVLKIEKSLRDSMIEFLIEKGIESRVYYPVPLHIQECYTDLGYKENDFPISMNASLSTFVLPVYPELGKEKLQYIVNAVREFCNDKKLNEVGKC